MTRLTRREFLKLCGTSSVGLMLAACGVAPTPTPHADTPAPVATTIRPIPTNTIAPTETAVAKVESSDWLSISESGGRRFHDASKAFSFVGSVDNKHHKLADYKVGTLNVGLLVNDDLVAKPFKVSQDGDVSIVSKDASQLALYIVGQAAVLNKQLDRVMKVRSNLANIYKNESNENNFHIIVDQDNAENWLAVYKKGDTTTRYKVANDGSLSEWKDYKMYDDRPLEIRDGKLLSGKDIFLPRGVVFSHFDFTSEWYKDGWTTTLKEDINRVVSLGANTAVFPLNSFNFDNEEFLDAFKKSIRYARERGLRASIELVGKERNAPYRKGNGQIIPLEKHYEIADRAELLRDWNKFLDKPGISQATSDYVDMMAPLSEPVYSISTGVKTDLTFLEWKSICDDLTVMFRNKIGREIPVLYSGTSWAREIRSGVNLQNWLPGTGIQIHPYWDVNNQYTNKRYMDDITYAMSRGFFVFPGEIGYNVVGNMVGKVTDQQQLDFFDQQLIFFGKNAMGGAYYCINDKRADNNGLLFWNGRLTDRGKRLEAFANGILNNLNSSKLVFT